MSNRRKLRGSGGHPGGFVPATRDSEGHNTVILEGPDGPAVERVCDLVARTFKGVCHPEHRVEHINRDRSDDRAVNLRYVPKEDASAEKERE